MPIDIKKLGIPKLPASEGFITSEEVKNPNLLRVKERNQYKQARDLALKQIDAQLSTIEQNYAKEIGGMLENEKKSSSSWHSGDNFGKIQAISKQYDASRTLFKRAKDRLEALTDDDYAEAQEKGQNIQGFWGNLWDGLTSRELKELQPFYSFNTGGGADGELSAALEKASKGEILNKSEGHLIEGGKFINQATQISEGRGGVAAGYTIGKGIAHSLPFIGELAANVLVPVGAAASGIKASATLAQLGKTGAVIAKGANALSKTGKIGTLLVKSATTAPFMSTFQDAYHQRTQDQFTINDDLSVVMDNPTSEFERRGKAYLTSAAANASEGIFSFFPAGAVGKVVKKISPRLYGSVISKIGTPGVLKFNNQLKKIFNYDGAIEEFSEETFNNLTEPLITGEPERIAENFTSENLMLTALSTTIMSTGFHAASLPSMVKDNIDLRVLKKESAGMLSQIANPEIRQQVYNAAHAQDIGDKVKKFTQIDWRGVDPLDAARSLDYVTMTTRREVLSGAAYSEDMQRELYEKREYYHQIANPETGNAETWESENGRRCYIRYDKPTNPGDGLRYAEDLETGEIGMINPETAKLVHAEPFEDYMQRTAEALGVEFSEKVQADIEQDMDSDAQEAGVSASEAVMSANGIKAEDVVGSYVTLNDGREVYVAAEQNGAYIGKWQNPETAEEEDLIIDPRQIADLSQPQITDVAPTPEVQEPAPVDYNAMSAAEFAQAYAAKYGTEAAIEDVQTQIKEVNRKIGQMTKKAGRTPAERFAKQEEIQGLRAQKSELEQVVASFSSDNVQPTEIITKPTVEQPQNTDALATGEYLSLEDYILRDISSGRKFLWSDSGVRRGIATELGFSSSFGERKARIGLLSNKDGVTIDEYADIIARELGIDMPAWNYDTHEIRSTIIDVLSGVGSRKQAREAAAQMRDVEQPTGGTIYDAKTLEEKHGFVTYYVTQFNQSSGANAEAVYSVEQLPEPLRTYVKQEGENFNIPGVTYQNRSYIFSRSVRDLNDLEIIYNHEVGGHLLPHRAIKSSTERVALFRQIVDDIGLEKIRSLNDIGLNEEISKLESKANDKYHVGREYLGYLAERNLTINDYHSTESAEKTVNLSDPLTEQGLIELIKFTANERNRVRVIEGHSTDATDMDAPRRGANGSSGADLQNDASGDNGQNSGTSIARSSANGEVEHSEDGKLGGGKEIPEGADVRGVGGVEQEVAQPGETINQNNQNDVTSTTIHTERDSARADELRSDEEPISSGRFGNTEQRGEDSVSMVEVGGGQNSGSRNNSSEGVGEPAAPGGVTGDNLVHSQEQMSRPEDGSARSAEPRGDDELNSARETISDARGGGSDQAVGAESATGNEPELLSEIRRNLPELYKEQQEDVLFAEKRFYAGENTGKGVLFTNGTGTGKTFTGLGIIKRYVNKGKQNIIIVVPTDIKVQDWIRDGRKLSLDVAQLSGIKDAGSGTVITTYANYSANKAIQERDFDLIVYDESHYLGQGKDGTAEAAFAAHKINAKLPSSVKQRVEEDFGSKKPTLKAPATTEERQQYDTDMEVWRDHVKAEVRRRVASVNVVFLSATPFAYHTSMQYADGTLFDIEETLENKERSYGYNTPQGFGEFLVSNLGYRMRYNKVTRPESGVDIDLMERTLSDRLQREGVMSGRVLSIDKDYSRTFIKVDSQIGEKINSGMKLFYDISDDGFRDKFPLLHEYAYKKWNYLYIDQLLETIKAGLVVDRIKQHLALGRKCVVFHSYNNSLPSHPFHFDANELVKGLKFDYDYKRGEMLQAMNDEITKFSREYPEYYNLDIGELKNLRALFNQTFGDRLREFNGVVSKAKRNSYVGLFNKADSGVDVILVQRKAGKEGISLHDTTGEKQRVLLDLGLPVAPTDAIQTEGRIYRLGTKSNAIIEYPVIMTDFEINAYATKIAQRVRTPENLAMGKQARDLENAFKTGYVDAENIHPREVTGNGGKETDVKFAAADDFDMARSYYYGQQKRTSKNKSSEGVDYFATPEPVGYKMVEWLDLQPNDEALEPSAGHGAIARFFPGDTKNVFVEPSYELATKVAINASGEVRQMTFESLSIWNKFDGIAMNPPFGVGGKTASEHLEKAFKHLRNNGRLVAILPTGPSMQKRFDKFMYGVDEKGKLIYPDAVMVASIELPGVTFERAGTSVGTRIVIIDKIENSNSVRYAANIDLASCKTVEELFDRIKELDVPKRNKTTEVRYRSVERGESQTLASVTIDEAISTMEAKIGVNVQRCATRAELPYHIRVKMKPSTRYSGVYDGEKIYMVLDEINSADEAVATYLHEVVAHGGLNQLLGKDGARRLYDKVFDALDSKTQARLLKKHGDKTVAGDEYVASIAEGDVTPSVMRRVLAAVREFLRDVLGFEVSISDADIRYILWKSRRNLQRAKTVGDSMRAIEGDQKLAKQVFDPVRFKTAEDTEEYKLLEGKSKIERKAIKERERWQDEHILVKILIDELKKQGVEIKPEDDIYAALNRYDSVAKEAMERFERKFIKPLLGVIGDLKGVTYDEVSDYLDAVHSIERHESGVNALAQEGQGEWTRSKCEGLITEFKSKTTEKQRAELWNKVRAINDENIRVMVAAGIMTEADAKAMRERHDWKYYVPLRGKDFEYEGELDLSEYYDYSFDRPGYSKKPTNTLGQKAEGRTSKSGDPIATMQQMGLISIMNAEKNKVNQCLLRLAQKSTNAKEIISGLDKVWQRKTPDGTWYVTDMLPTKEEVTQSAAAKRELIQLHKDMREAVKLHKEAVVTELKTQIADANDRIVVSSTQNHFGSGYQGITNQQKKQHYVAAMQNGVEYRIRLTDPAVANAINGILTYKHSEIARWKLSRLVAGGTRFLAAASTSRNPVFVLTNYIRDIQHAYTYSLLDTDGNATGYMQRVFTSYKPIHRYFNEQDNPLTAKELAGYNFLDAKDRDLLAQRYGNGRVDDTLFQLFRDNGGRTGFVHLEDVAAYKKKLMREVKRMQKDGMTWGKAMHTIGSGFDWMSEMTETSVRYATFLSQIDTGVDVLTAVNYAKDVTVNFNRKGTYGKSVGSYIMFFNAGVQGFYNMAKLTAHNKGKALAAIATLATVSFLNSMLLDMMLAASDDDEDWQISDYERRMNIIIPISWEGKKYMKIPIPILFRPAWNIGVTTSDYLAERIGAAEAAATLFSVTLDSTSPVDVEAKSPIKAIIPSIVKPLFEIGVFNSDFTGREINKKPFLASQEGWTPDSQLGRYDASELSKALTRELNKVGGGNEFRSAGKNQDGTDNKLASWLDISPSTLDHLFFSYTGGIGREVSRIVNVAVSDEKREQVRNYPLVGRFVGEAYDRSPAGDYYDLKNQISNSLRVNKLALKNGESDAEVESLIGNQKETAVQLKITDKKIRTIKDSMEDMAENTPEFDAAKDEIRKLQREFIKYYNDNNDR